MSEPSPPFKGLMMFRVARSAYGWNESVWLHKSSFESSLKALEDLVERRLAILPDAVAINDIRITNPRLPRAAMIKIVNRTGTFVSDKLAHPPWTVLILRLASGGYYTKYNLGGLPREAGGLTTLPTQEWTAAFENFADALKRNCVTVNVKHLPRGTAANGQRETVVNDIQSVNMMRVSARKRGMGHSYPPRGRRARRKVR